MLIEVSQIPPDGLDIVLPEEVLDLGAPADTWDGPATVRADLHVGRSGRGLLISGSYSGGVALVCSRCLEPFNFQTEDRFALYCEIAAQGPLKIAACFPRAVKWLFHTAKADLPLDASEVLNMRVQSAEEVCAALFNGKVKANLPQGKVTASDAPKSAPPAA